MRVIREDRSRTCACGKPLVISSHDEGDFLEWGCDGDDGQEHDAAFGVLRGITAEDIDVVWAAILSKPTVARHIDDTVRFMTPDESGTSLHQRLVAKTVDMLEQLAALPRPRGCDETHIHGGIWEREMHKIVTGWFDVEPETVEYLPLLAQAQIPIFTRACKSHDGCSHPCFMPLLGELNGEVTGTFHEDGTHSSETMVLVRACCALLDRLDLTASGNIRETPQEAPQEEGEKCE